MAITLETYVYIGLMLAGIVFLLFSLIGGGSGDGDVGGDMGHDVGHDVGGGDGAPGLSPLSMPMMATFMGVMGAAGTALSVAGWDTVTTAMISVVAGVISFAGLFFVVANFLVKSQSSSTIHEKEYEGKTATITDAIPEGGIGAIALNVRGIRQSVSAKSTNGGRIGVGKSVLVTRVQDSMAFVEELKEPVRTGE